MHPVQFGASRLLPNSCLLNPVAAQNRTELRGSFPGSFKRKAQKFVRTRGFSKTPFVWTWTWFKHFQISSFPKSGLQKPSFWITMLLLECQRPFRRFRGSGEQSARNNVSFGRMQTCYFRRPNLSLLPYLLIKNPIVWQVDEKHSFAKKNTVFL